jgi:hypothetical protein
MVTMTIFKNVDHIITAKHYGGSAREYIRKTQRKIHMERGIAVTIKDLDKEPIGVPVYGYIRRGQWLADCECNSTSFVDPDEPIFFCFGCGNRSNGQKPRPVIFPPDDERKEIERLLLLRPVDDLRGLTDNERAGMAEPVLYVEIEEEEFQTPTLDDMMVMAQTGKLPPRARTVKTLPLPRSWDVGETIDDLHDQQDRVIKLWKQKIQDGG